MKIYTNVSLSNSSVKEEQVKTVLVEEVAEKPAIKKEKKKKYIAPIVEETVEVIEENKSEDEDLSQWLEEDIDD